jgi:hypothetical protein
VFGVARVLVGTSGSPGSLHALRYGEGLARALDAVLIPVIAWELPGDDRAHRVGSSRELGHACRDLASQQLRDALMAVWGEVPDDPRVQPHVERGPGLLQGGPLLPGPCPVPRRRHLAAGEPGLLRKPGTGMSAWLAEPGGLQVQAALKLLAGGRA